MLEFDFPHIHIIGADESDEKAAFHAISQALKLASFIKRYKSALSLYDAAASIRQKRLADIQAETADPKHRMLLIQSFQTDPTLDWDSIAQRDAVMTVYHYGKTLEGIQFKECPTLREMVDHKTLRQARTTSKGTFQMLKG